MEAAIRTIDLSRHFGEVAAVEGLNLEVPKGIIFGFLGPNGAGKTTTIRLLLGLLEPTSGRAEVLGFDTVTQGDLVRARTGALLEFDGLYERLTAYDNLDLYGRIYGLNSNEREARIEEMLRHMALWDRRDEPVVQWSRGMRQKLAVARALLHQPSLVFLDEPTSGLDPVAAADLHDDLEGLVEGNGLTVFLTTHNLAEAEKICDMVGVISRGRLLAVGRPDELRARVGEPVVEIVGRGFTEEVISKLGAHEGIVGVIPNGDRLTVRIAPGTDTSSITRFLINAGAEVSEIHRSNASLEQVFLTLVEEGGQA